jgi:hypothetical protein
VQLTRRLDVYWTWLSFACSLAAMLFSHIVQHYSFMAGR